MVEVGVYLGRSLCYLADQIRRSGKSIRLIGIDTFTGSGVENQRDNHTDAVTAGGGTFVGETHRNLIACGFPWVELIVAESVKAAKLFSFMSVDFVFLDARHDYPSVCADIAAWVPKITTGGILAGDDYGVPGQPLVWPDVKRAVDEMLPRAVGSPHDCFFWVKQ